MTRESNFRNIILKYTSHIMKICGAEDASELEYVATFTSKAVGDWG